MDRYLEANRRAWDNWTGLHLKSELYDVPGFKAGKTSLQEIELGELGDVAGKDLLHLQCHFGMDTLSWGRLGARATGVDFSDQAIRTARNLGEELGIEARFLQADIYDLPNLLDDRFDIVFTSYGVVWWLPDLEGWARMVSHFLKPGGVFYMVEFHPVLTSFGDNGEHFEYPYFFEPEPDGETAEGSYADPDSPVETTTYGWSHHLGEIVSVLAGEGLTIKYLHEFPYSPYGCWPFLEESSPGRWTPKGLGDKKIPGVFSIRAEKP